MPLLGQAAMLLSFDIAEEAIAEHDDWHTHEHMPERLSIPGFLRGTRWVALRGHPRYLVLYEVEALATLKSGAYLERLNNPTPWTSKIMRHYRGMNRGFCSVSASFGPGIGGFCVLLRFEPDKAAGPSLRAWLTREVLPKLPARPGLAGVHLLEGAVTPEMTSEQRIRGADAAVDWALVVNGYSQDALENLMRADLRHAQLAQHGAKGILDSTYRFDYSLTDGEATASGPSSSGR